MKKDESPKVNRSTINEAKRQKERKKIRFSEEEQLRHTIAWTTYYRRNMHKFIMEYLDIKLKLFQIIMIYLMSCSKIVVYIMSRGVGKSFIVAIYSVAVCLLYPNSEVMIASLTLNQASLIIKEKIDKELSGDLALSPVLRYLRETGYMKFKYDKDKAFVEFKNGSKIFSAVCGEESRGIRSTVVIIDEARLVKKKDVDGILIPTQRPRVYPARLKPEYADCYEEPQQIYLSSAKTKDNWLYRFMIKTVNNFYHHNYLNEDDKLSYGFLATDIYTAVAEGIKTEAQLQSDKANTNELDFEMESYNLWLGENEDSIFTYDMFHQQQTLESGFVPTSNYEQFPERDTKKKVRVLGMDIAVASGRDNDNSVYGLGYYDEKTGKKRIEYIRAYNGLNSIKQVVLAKRLFYDYGCEYFVVDTKGELTPHHIAMYG